MPSREPEAIRYKRSDNHPLGAGREIGELSHLDRLDDLGDLRLDLGIDTAQHHGKHVRRS